MSKQPTITTVVADDGRFIRQELTPGYYSRYETELRRMANRSKYLPTEVRPRFKALQREIVAGDESF